MQNVIIMLIASNAKKREKIIRREKGDCKYRKVYIVLFADMVSRAVDLQLIQNRTTESFLMAFIRMTSAKSTPRFILSDNAAEFVRADKEIQEVMQLISSEEVRKQLGEQGIEWRFTPARSPQHNGLTEILIKSAKKTLYKIFKGKRFTETELTTAVKQCEGQLNDIPLVAISDDKDDNNLLTITPAHLLLGRPLLALPSSWDQVSLDRIKRMSVVSRWEQRKLLQRRFFLRWQQEYLDSLKKRTKNHAQQKNLKNGDIVLLLNERKTRLSRPIARVEHVMLSRDNQVRSVLLRLPSSHFPNNTQKKKPVSDKGTKETKENNDAMFVRRGIEQLCLLEAQLDDAEDNSVHSVDTDCPTPEVISGELHTQDGDEIRHSANSDADEHQN